MLCLTLKLLTHENGWREGPLSIHGEGKEHISWDSLQDWCRKHEPYCILSSITVVISDSKSRECENAAELEKETEYLIKRIEDDGVKVERTFKMHIAKEPPLATKEQVLTALRASQISYLDAEQKVKDYAKGWFNEVVCGVPEQDGGSGRVVLCVKESQKQKEMYLAVRGTVNFEDFKANLQAWFSSFLEGSEVHSGFHDRAEVIERRFLKEWLEKGHKLILCGHSLGGATAAVLTWRLLENLTCGNTSLSGNMRFIGFGVPYWASKMTAAEIHDNYHARRLFTCVVANGDPVPSLLASTAALRALAENADRLTGNMQLASAVAQLMFPDTCKQVESLWKQIWEGIKAKMDDPRLPDLYAPVGVFVLLTDNPAPKIVFDKSDDAVKSVKSFEFAEDAYKRHCLAHYWGLVMQDVRKIPCSPPPPCSVSDCSSCLEGEAMLIIHGKKDMHLKLKSVPLLPHKLEMLDKAGKIVVSTRLTTKVVHDATVSWSAACLQSDSAL